MEGPGTDISSRLRRLFSQLCEGLYERETEIKLCLLAAIAGESVFLLGPPGTGKSLVARRVQFAFAGARSFDYLMGRFSTPEEIFGPVSIALLKNEDKYVRNTAGYLPDADIVFLDEIWKASPPIQNALLTALNERVFRNGDREIPLPLKLLVGASNEHSGAEPAFWDRFLIRLRVEALKHPDSFAAMILDKNDPYRDTVAAADKIDAAQWETWKSSVDAVAIGTEVLSALTILRSRLADDVSKSPVSDRRWKKIARVIRAAAFCNGRTTATLLDCAPALYCLWDQPEEIPLAQALLQAACTEALDAEIAVETEAAAVQIFLSHARETMRSRETETVREALLVDEEYLVFERFPQAKNDDLEFRLWQHDAESLAGTGGATDIFVYKEGTYLDTIRKTVSRGTAEFEYLVDGQTARIKTGEFTRVSKASRILGVEEAAALARESESLRSAMETKAAAVGRHLESLKSQAENDLFCPPHHAAVLAETYAKALEKLGDSAASFETGRKALGLGTP